MQKEIESLGERTGSELTEEPNWQTGSVKIEATGPKTRFGEVQILKATGVRIPETLGAALILISVMSVLNVPIKPSVGRKFSNARPEI